MFDLSFFKNFFFNVNNRYLKEALYLNKLDSLIGDGDHGDTISRGFHAVALEVDSEFEDIGSLLDAVSQTLAEQTGGAIGPILAAFFAEGGLVCRDSKTCTLDHMIQFFDSGILAVQSVGEASLGDKTLLDAMAPALQAFRLYASAPIEKALSEAAIAAWQGAQATASMPARRGRAAFLSERSIGHEDPGAVSFAMLLDCLVATAVGKFSSPPSSDMEELPFNPIGKFINSAHDMIRQDIDGLVLSRPDIVRLTSDGLIIRAVEKSAGKVGLAIGHGGGHTPSMGGMVGYGLLDADVYGPLFTCASGIKIARAIQLADHGAGVALLVSNHSGDVLNARLAQRRAEAEGHQVAFVRLGDDIATAPREDLANRRGLGGMLFALKTGGAAAEQGCDLNTVGEVMRRTNERTVTLSVAARPPTHPISGEPLFELERGKVEIGTGVHGEPGVYRGTLLPSKQLVAMILERLVDDLRPFIKDSVWVFLNGSGGTSRMELNIIYQDVHNWLADHNLTISANIVESLFTTQEMGGFSLSLCAPDKDMQKLWQVPARGAYFHCS